MPTIKSFTDLSQSRKLAEILPLESADMHYVLTDSDQETYSPGLGKYYGVLPSIPCWSLAVLLNIIPQEIFNGEYVINITEGCDENWVITYDHIDNKNHSFYGLSTGADNLIDACYEMILKLNEQKLL